MTAMFSLIKVSTRIARSKRPTAMSSVLSATTCSPPLKGSHPFHRIVTTAREFQKANQLQLRTIPTVSFLTEPTQPRPCRGFFLPAPRLLTLSVSEAIRPTGCLYFLSTSLKASSVSS
jgi:hypothetical protein